MQAKQIKSQLYEIGKSYPTLLGLMSKQVGDDTVGNNWAKIIMSKHLDAAHFENVCYEYAMMERPLPKLQEQLIGEIISETKNRMAADEARLEQHMKYHQTNLGSWLYDERSNVAEACKYLMENKNVSQRKVDELVAYAKGKCSRPEWINEASENRMCK